MIGAITGDIVGSRFEFNNHRSTDFELFTEECFATDDSIMTLAVAKAIMETDRVYIVTNPDLDRKDIIYLEQLTKNTVHCMQQIGRKYPDCGYGGNFGQWIFSPNPQPYKSYGNGAAMRISSVAAVARSLEETKILSRVVTEISHNHEEGIKGAEATAAAIYLAKTGQSKERIRQFIIDHYYAIDFTLDEIRESYRFNETCQETVPQAIEAFLESESFEDAIRLAISIGGDSDTVAAITGSIAEAFYDGVPKNLSIQAMRFLDNDLQEILDEFNGE